MDGCFSRECSLVEIWFSPCMCDVTDSQQGQKEQNHRGMVETSDLCVWLCLHGKFQGEHQRFRCNKLSVTTNSQWNLVSTYSTAYPFKLLKLRLHHLQIRLSLNVLYSLWMVLPIQSSRRFNINILWACHCMADSDAAAWYRADLIKCGSTLTGLNKPTDFCWLTPACDWHSV